MQTDTDQDGYLIGWGQVAKYLRCSGQQTAQKILESLGVGVIREGGRIVVRREAIEEARRKKEKAAC